MRAWARAARRCAMVDPVREAALVPGCPEHVALWDAINAYSAACGGHPTRGGGGVRCGEGGAEGG